MIVLRLLNALLGGLLQLVILAYRWALSPALHFLVPGSGCRFQPTCSAYALEAVKTHGPWRGSYLAIRRIMQCHPWGPHGYDPVPPPTQASEMDVASTKTTHDISPRHFSPDSGIASN